MVSKIYTMHLPFANRSSIQITDVLLDQEKFLKDLKKL